MPAPHKWNGFKKKKELFCESGFNMVFLSLFHLDSAIIFAPDYMFLPI